MYKPTKLEQKFFNHRQKMHRGRISPACKVCHEFMEKIEKDSKMNVKQNK